MLIRFFRHEFVKGVAFSTHLLRSQQGRGCMSSHTQKATQRKFCKDKLLRNAPMYVHGPLVLYSTYGMQQAMLQKSSYFQTFSMRHVMLLVYQTTQEALLQEIRLGPFTRTSQLSMPAAFLHVQALSFARLVEDCRCVPSGQKSSGPCQRRPPGRMQTLPR